MGLGETIDKGRVVVAVHEEPNRGEPLQLVGRVRLDLGLGPHQEVAVQVESVLVRPAARYSPVGVRRGDDDHDCVVEEVVDGGVGAVWQRHEIADDLHHRVGALAFPAVDVRFDEDGQLDVPAPGGKKGVRPRRVCRHQATKLLPSRIVGLLLRCFERVDNYAEDVATKHRLTDHRVVQAIRHARSSGFVLELIQGALDGAVGDERKRVGLGDVLAPDGGTPLLSVGRPQAG
jgi:hypothetical protein